MKCSKENELITDSNVISLLIISFKTQSHWPITLKKILEKYISVNYRIKKIDDIYSLPDSNVLKYIQYIY